MEEYVNELKEYRERIGVRYSKRLREAVLAEVDDPEFHIKCHLMTAMHAFEYSTSFLKVLRSMDIPMDKTLFDQWLKKNVLERGEYMARLPSEDLSMDYAEWGRTLYQRAQICLEFCGPFRLYYQYERPNYHLMADEVFDLYVVDTRSGERKRYNFRECMRREDGKPIQKHSLWKDNLRFQLNTKGVPLMMMNSGTRRVKNVETGETVCEAPTPHCYKVAIGERYCFYMEGSTCTIMENARVVDTRYGEFSEECYPKHYHKGILWTEVHENGVYRKHQWSVNGNTLKGMKVLMCAYREIPKEIWRYIADYLCLDL